ncbi:MAG: hypothetical protein K2O31_06360, partial [Clostridia bacterium]|nr:hypothetical protein [Clostridia bacterium]
NRLFYKTVNQKKAIYYATGFIGTPIHELSHALFCLIFFHKIEEMKLFQIDDENGVLGYVRHSYNKKNPYQLMGNYFIGVAPIICGALIVFLATRFLLPAAYTDIEACLNDMMLLQNKGLSWDWISYSFATLSETLKVFFINITMGWRWWLFTIIVLCIALHMNLSGADIKSAVTGIPFVIIIITVTNILLGFCFFSVYNKFILFMSTAGNYLIGALFISLIFSMSYVTLGGIGKLGINIIKRIKVLKK